MEVHHHAHTTRKKWTHYFWEFLMLFLAVFCGFLAEYQLEHTIEHQREKKYISSLIADLKGDTTEIRSAIAFNLSKIRGLDTLASLLNKPVISSAEKRELSRLNWQYATNIYTMTFNDRTVRQLLNSGNLRLIRSQATSDSIINYYGSAKDDIVGQGKHYEDMSLRLIVYAEDIFNSTFTFLKLNAENSLYWESVKVDTGLLTSDPKVFKKYAQMVLTAKGFLALYLDMLFDMRKRSERLLLYLQKEYQIT